MSVCLVLFLMSRIQILRYVHNFENVFLVNSVSFLILAHLDIGGIVMESLLWLGVISSINLYDLLLPKSFR